MFENEDLWFVLEKDVVVVSSATSSPSVLTSSSSRRDFLVLLKARAEGSGGHVRIVTYTGGEYFSCGFWP